eukprot:scaffold14053_cov102-Isochrysis_galbana.AAC.7
MPVGGCGEYRLLKEGEKGQRERAHRDWHARVGRRRLGRRRRGHHGPCGRHYVVSDRGQGPRFSHCPCRRVSITRYAWAQVQPNAPHLAAGPPALGHRVCRPAVAGGLSARDGAESRVTCPGEQAAQPQHEPIGRRARRLGGIPQPPPRHFLYLWNHKVASLLGPADAPVVDGQLIGPARPVDSTAGGRLRLIRVEPALLRLDQGAGQLGPTHRHREVPDGLVAKVPGFGQARRVGRGEDEARLVQQPVQLFAEPPAGGRVACAAHAPPASRRLWGRPLAAAGHVCLGAIRGGRAGRRRRSGGIKRLVVRLHLHGQRMVLGGQNPRHYPRQACEALGRLGAFGCAVIEGAREHRHKVRGGAALVRPPERRVSAQPPRQPLHSRRRQPLGPPDRTGHRQDTSTARAQIHPESIFSSW